MVKYPRIKENSINYHLTCKEKDCLWEFIGTSTAKVAKESSNHREWHRVRTPEYIELQKRKQEKLDSFVRTSMKYEKEIEEKQKVIDSMKFDYLSLDENSPKRDVILREVREIRGIISVLESSVSWQQECYRRAART